MNDSLGPRLVAPPGACDCHMHIYDPRFRAAPSWPIALPDAPVSDYRNVQRQLGLERAVVVQPNGYAFDNACTEDALRQMGASVRGIATVRRMRALAAAQPDRCVWASNWPHPGTSPTPSNTTMLDLLLDWAPDETLRRKILVDNPARLYGFANA